MDQELNTDETPTREFPGLHVNTDQTPLRDLEVRKDQAKQTTGAGKVLQQEVQFTYVVTNT